MASYDTWDKIDEEEDQELQDFSAYETNRDVILFCIDCSPSMLELYDDPVYEGVQTCHLYKALDAAMQIEKKKIISGPNDSIGILLFNTTRKTEITKGQGAEIKKGTFLYQPISLLSAPKVLELAQLLEACQEDPEELRKTLPPLETGRVPMGDVFTSCNWVLRDGAPKTASKRIFLITDEDSPHPNKKGNNQLATSARTTLIDLAQAGVTVEPFFIGTEEKPFDVAKFYRSVLLPNNVEEEEDLQEGASVLPESISISRIEDLLSQMRFREVPKRALFSVPFQLADGFTIGIKGYGLVTEQKIGAYKHFYDLGDRMEVASSVPETMDEDRQTPVAKPKIMLGVDLGGASAQDKEQTPLDGEPPAFGARVVKAGNRPFFTADEVRSFRTMELEPGIKLLGFKDKEELHFEDNVKHSQFVYPDEMAYSGSKRTFSALLKSMVKKDKIAIALCLTRRNATPSFCALLPQVAKPSSAQDMSYKILTWSQEEFTDKSGWTDPAGFHVIPLPFADDIRQANDEVAHRASQELQDTAFAWVDKLVVKNGSYPPDSYPNPTLAFFHDQLEATAFREEYDPDSFEDLTLPPVKQIHKRAGALLRKWKEALSHDETVNAVAPATGTKRKAEAAVPLDEDEVRKMHEKGTLAKLRVSELKEFLGSKGQPNSGLKAVLVERVETWLSQN
ncbi:hypothetical protein D9619_005038 [Psilocybe cf. subviscida]|uniref:ATP-dependent DNA helicase II subunit 1 n=1 Tax=Psilocybe cf. subviscida TaxID=2480587 RepID=A0A8H5F8F5_9AGAR|nr:hypothetical protein D9619_005038 [Psilocybe cf. subviscida]